VRVARAGNKAARFVVSRIRHPAMRASLASNAKRPDADAPQTSARVVAAHEPAIRVSPIENKAPIVVSQLKQPAIEPIVSPSKNLAMQPSAPSAVKQPRTAAPRSAPPTSLADSLVAGMARIEKTIVRITARTRRQLIALANAWSPMTTG
jgi:hypothetical protein